MFCASDRSDAYCPYAYLDASFCSMLQPIGVGRQKCSNVVGSPIPHGGERVLGMLDWRKSLCDFAPREGCCRTCFDGNIDTHTVLEDTFHIDGYLLSGILPTLEKDFIMDG